MNRYAVSVLAVRFNATTMAHQCANMLLKVDAHSEAEAIGIGVQKGRAAWPDSDGWGAPSVLSLLIGE